MLMTIKEVSVLLQIKPSTLYAWAAQGKIPARKIHGLLRFDREAVAQWLAGFSRQPPQSLHIQPKTPSTDVDVLIARAKRSFYTAPREKPDDDRAQQGG